MPDYRNDNEFVSAAIAGNEDAMSKLITSVMPSIESAASLNAGNGTITRSDLIQEGLIGAINAIFSFDESKGAKFSTYAQRCISNRIASVVRDSSREKRRPGIPDISLEDVEVSLSENLSNPESVVSMEEGVQAIQKCIDTKLTALERDVIMLHIAEADCDEIAEKLGISRKSVNNALSRGRQKIRAEIKKNL